MHVTVVFDSWKTMRRLENEYNESGISELSFTQFVMLHLQCPTYTDAEIAVGNYERSKREAT